MKVQAISPRLHIKNIYSLPGHQFCKYFWWLDKEVKTMSLKENDVFEETKRETREENSLSAKVHGWARKLEKTLEQNKWSGICWNKSGMCEDDYCRCK